MTQQSRTKQFKHEDLTGKIIQACFDVSNELGTGFLESVYKNALLIMLNQYGLTAKDEVPIAVQFRGMKFGQFYADIVVENKVLIELKAISNLKSEHKAQVINYLKASELDVGLLVNFGKPKIEIRRLFKP